jgi:hypothetical protein
MLSCRLLLASCGDVTSIVGVALDDVVSAPLLRAPCELSLDADARKTLNKLMCLRIFLAGTKASLAGFLLSC